MKTFPKILLSLLLCYASVPTWAQFGYLTGTVSDKFGPLAEASVTLEGTPYGIHTDVQGYYAFQLDTGTYLMEIKKPGYKSVLHQVIVRDYESTEILVTLESTVLEQDVASGSLSKVLVRQMESSVPIDVITGQQIMDTNQPNLSAALHYLIPTFYSVDQTIADGTDFVTPASMRGLSPDQVLILVNGKRRHKSALVHVNGTFGRGAAGTDLNTIPMISIERIEVLRYGAAAQYGSDAISGVLNIVLKEETGEAHFQIDLAGTQGGDGQVEKIAGNYGFSMGGKGFLSFTCEFLNKQSINRSGNYTGIIYGDSRDQDPVARATFFDQTGLEMDKIMKVGGASTQNANLTYNGSFKPKEDMELYFFGGINYRKGSSTGYYRLPYDSAKVVHYIYEEGFSPEISPDILDKTFVLGERGKIKDWYLDFNVNLSENTFDYTINNSLNASLGIASPLTVYAGGFSYGHKIASINLTRRFEATIPVNVSFGAEYKLENFSIRKGDEESYYNGGDTTNYGQPREVGFQVFSGFTPENEIHKLRSNIAGYLELKGDLTPKLEIITAARLESYFNHYGPNISVKATGRYKFSDLLILRGGFSTGFKAPSLHQLYYSRISTQFVDGLATRVANYNNESTLARLFGIDELIPETSKNYSIGVTSRPFRNFSTSLDFYRIDIEDRIVLTGQFSGDDDPIFDQVFDVLGVQSAQFFANAVSTVSWGFDYFLAYQLIRDHSKLDLSIGFNYSATDVTNIKASGILNQAPVELFNREEVARLESNVPRSKLIFDAKYSLKRLSVNLRNTYFGIVEYKHPDDGDPANWPINQYTGQAQSRDQLFASKIITDLDVTFQITPHVFVSTGANNLFNVYPDKQNHSANVEEGRFVYSRRVQQFGVAGAYYFGQLIFKI
ncbi:hypothetical protein BFP72_16845 [Reichenbachiella sp. 5M10]|uniref:TonB-dependent receptor n=1 Tax=Reichenbachiella sp. 5M10 TaxID=1889772 RepID=UPI000C146E46|nr:TonB-dependent receptor [Reichenbachiella sp. 5M10]PIB36951.1 hypothetical protein BFP72_16845 [Reichenbachiella sp. 5M10]